MTRSTEIRHEGSAWVSERLSLSAVDDAEARRIVARDPVDGDAWVADFPADGDIVACGALLRGWEAHGDPRPFGFHRIDRRSDGRAIGGVGFHGPPDRNGHAEIGYGLAASARGQGFATEAVRVIVAVAIEAGVARLVAGADPANAASQTVLHRTGFRHTGAKNGFEHFALDLPTCSS